MSVCVCVYFICGVNVNNFTKLLLLWMGVIRFSQAKKKPIDPSNKDNKNRIKYQDLKNPPTSGNSKLLSLSHRQRSADRSAAALWAFKKLFCFLTIKSVVLLLLRHHLFFCAQVSMGWKGKLVNKAGHYLSQSLEFPLKQLHKYASSPTTVFYLHNFICVCFVLHQFALSDDGGS